MLLLFSADNSLEKNASHPLRGNFIFNIFYCYCFSLFAVCTWIFCSMIHELFFHRNSQLFSLLFLQVVFWWVINKFIFFDFSHASPSIDSCLVYGVKPSLIQVYEEHDICWGSLLVTLQLQKRSFNSPSLKQATRWAVGIVIMNAKISSMKVLNALYMKARQGSDATLLSLSEMEIISVLSPN